ncbi:hypothetical protein TSUD_231660 [Trifolium subterraneum]|uniref:Uncharacterized protein n=1 Tax=Trifolium subterraneum TaxID=3900 RepID=A0A2Z6M876_TRISU|nr:hypothetical protein TSUD_231660 [Trifolium subterraneum]
MSESHITSSSNSPLHDNNIPNSNQPQQEPWPQIPYAPQDATHEPWTQIPYAPQNTTQAPWTQIPYAPQQGYSPPFPFWSPQPFGANYISPIFPTFNAPWDPSTYLAMRYPPQQFCEAQSCNAQLMENAQLWAMVSKLQAEISDCKDRLTKLKEEVSSLKHEFERPTNEIVRTIPVGTRQPRKRGRRPEQSSSSEEALYESD